MRKNGNPNTLVDEQHQSRARMRLALEYASTVALVVASAAVVVMAVQTWSSRSGGPRRSPTPAPPQSVQSLEATSSVGATSAKVALIAYSDFECPYCQRFAVDTWPALKAQYIDQGKLRFVFRHFPLAIHPQATSAAVAAECAGRQGQFWPMHDLLFANQRQLNPARITLLSQGLRLDHDAFAACKAEPAVASDQRAGRAIGIVGTPTFLLGRSQDGGGVKVSKVIVGALPIETIKQSIDQLLNE
jgi:protein-disulfide isomerase